MLVLHKEGPVKEAAVHIMRKLTRSCAGQVSDCADFEWETSMLRFGQVPAYQMDGQFDFGLSDDRRAFTLSFSDLQVTVGHRSSTEPMATHVFSIVVPLEGSQEKTDIAFHLSDAFVKTMYGATATILFTVNDQSIVADFTEDTEESFMRELTFAAQRTSECRLCVFLLVGRDSNNPDAEAFLNVLTIDAEILPRAGSA